MSDAYYPGREVTVALQALVDEPRHAPGSLLRQHKVLEDGLDQQVILLQSLSLSSASLLVDLL